MPGFEFQVRRSDEMEFLELLILLELDRLITVNLIHPQTESRTRK
jgi:hypothetical protein